MRSFLHIDTDSHFTLHNIPFGIFSTQKETGKRCGTIIGSKVIDLRALSRAGAFDDILCYSRDWFEQDVLNMFAEQIIDFRRAVRLKIQELFTVGSPLENASQLLKRVLYESEEVQMHLPVQVGDYTDFCASRYHTENAGRLMKVPGPLLPPAWNHLPIGYHGRASSIVVSGTPVIRPKSVLPPNAGCDRPEPFFGPTKSLDMEYEMAAIMGGQGNNLGGSISVQKAEDNIFGLVIMNDWSARDIQGFEMIPLGPFNGKNFATTVSPWVITLDSLTPFRTELPTRIESLPLAKYLTFSDPLPTIDIPLEMSIRAVNESSASVIMRSNLKHLAYSFSQLVAHHTISGCPMRAGDMLGSGTISGPEPNSLACLLEITERGTKPLTTAEGKEMIWLSDGDEVLMTAVASRVGEEGEPANVGFGVCTGKILPAIVL